MWEERVIGRSVTMNEAKLIVEAMLHAAMNPPEDPTNPTNSRMAFAVVDTAGVLVYFVRMDAGSALNTQVAINKAYSCIYNRQNTWEHEEFLKRLGHDMASLGEPRLSLIPGGVLIRHKDSSIAGAIGLSGRPALDPMGDVELANIGAKAFLDSLE